MLINFRHSIIMELNSKPAIKSSLPFEILGTVLIRIAFFEPPRCYGRPME